MPGISLPLGASMWSVHGHNSLSKERSPEDLLSGRNLGHAAAATVCLPLPPALCTGDDALDEDRETHHSQVTEAPKQPVPGPQFMFICLETRFQGTRVAHAEMTQDLTSSQLSRHGCQGKLIC